MKFNINEFVRIKLTPEGKAALAADNATFCAKYGLKREYTPPVEDSEGWSRWQLWTLMQELGSHLRLGGPTMFETEIDIPIAAPQGDSQ